MGTVARAARLMTAGRWAFLGLYLIFQVVAALPAIGVSVALSDDGDPGRRNAGQPVN